MYTKMSKVGERKNENKKKLLEIIEHVANLKRSFKFKFSKKDSN